MKKKMQKKNPAGRSKTRVRKAPKVKKVMREFSKGDLHSGSKKGPKVKSRKQAVAIALSEARKAGELDKPKKKKKKSYFQTY